MTTDVVIPEQDLPDWMRRAQRGADWGLLLALLLSLIVAWPFIHYEELPRNTAAEAYVFQASDTAGALQEGRFYPRWSPHAQGGYGAPIPNYYPPATSYISGLFTQLITNSPIFAVRLTFILFYMLAGTMMYTLVKHLTNANAGLIATALYLFNPYVALTVPHILGDLSVVMILGALPTFLWATNRFLTRTYPSRLLYVSLSFAGILLIDPRYGMVALVLGSVLFLRPAIQRKQILQFVGGIVLGVGMSTFFWLPALAEYSLVRWVVPSHTGHPLEVNLADLFALGQVFDPSTFTQVPQLSVGIALPIIFLLSLGFSLWLRKRVIIPMTYAALGVLLLGLQVIFFADDAVLLVPILLTLSIASTNIFQLIRQWKWRKRQLLITVLALVGVMYVAIPILTHTQTHFPVSDHGPPAQLQHENLGWGAAVLPPAALIPTTLPASPPTDLLATYGTSVFNRLTSSSGVGNRIFSEYEGSHRHRYQIDITDATSLIFQRAYFPIWQIQLNGVAIQPQLDPRTGLVRVSVPEAVQGTLQINLGSTPIRVIAWQLSILSVVISLGIVRFWWFDYSDAIFEDDSDLFSNRSARVLLGVIVVIMGMLWFYINTDLFDDWQPQPEIGLIGRISLLRETDVGIDLIGYKRFEQTYSPGDTMQIMLFWAANQAITENYQVQVSVRHIDTNEVWQESTLRHPAYYPTSRWDTRGYATDQYYLPLPTDMPTGFYTFDVQLFRCDNAGCDLDNPITFNAPNGAPLGERLSVIQPLAVR